LNDLALVLSRRAESDSGSYPTVVKSAGLFEVQKSNLRLADSHLLVDHSGSMSLRVRGDRVYPAASHEWGLVMCGVWPRTIMILSKTSHGSRHQIYWSSPLVYQPSSVSRA
jgi:hypothetical protein